MMLQHLLLSCHEQWPHRVYMLGDVNATQNKTCPFFYATHRMTYADVDLSSHAKDTSRLDMAHHLKDALHDHFMSALTSDMATNLSAYTIQTPLKKATRYALEDLGILHKNRLAIVKTFAHNDNIWLPKAAGVCDSRVHNPPPQVLDLLATQQPARPYQYVKSIYSDHLMVSGLIVVK